MQNPPRPARGAPITSRDNERVKAALKLSASAASRAEAGLFFAEGVRLCLDLAACAPPKVVFAAEALLAARPEIAALGGEVLAVSEGVAEKLAGTRSPQGLCALFELPRPGWDALRPAEGLLVCEGVQDPANLGAMVRSAAGLGLGGLVLLARPGGPACADPFGPKALRASMGAALRLPVLRCNAAEEALAWLTAQNVPLYAAAADGPAPPEWARPAGPFAVAVGNEGAGLSPGLLARAAARVSIPMHNGVESLNAAAAAAIIMYALKAVHN